MTRRLEDEIRGYANMVDENAPPVEELLPPGMAEELGLDPTEIQVTTTLRPLEERRSIPGWLTGLVTAAAIIALMIPLWIWLGTGRDEVANTVPTSLPTPTTLVTPTTAPGQAETGSPRLTWDRSGHVVSGSGWQPDSTVTLTLGATEISADSDASGHFVMPPTSFAECCSRPLTVSDGSSTISMEVPGFEIVRVDPENDIVAGTTSLPGQVNVRILGADPYETSALPTNGGWFVDFTGEYDLLPGMLVEAWVESSEITVSFTQGTRVDPWLGLRPASDIVEGGQFLPNAPVSLNVDGTDLPKPSFADASGHVDFDLGSYGLGLQVGSVVIADDGASVLTAVVPSLTFDVFDPSQGIASGTTDLPDGTEIQVELLLAPDGASEATDYSTVVTLASGGRWSLRFDPAPPGMTIIQANVTNSGNPWTQTQAPLP